MLFQAGQEVIWKTMFEQYFSGTILSVEAGFYLIRREVPSISMCTLSTTFEEIWAK